jgi:hypothetical protein
MKLIFTKLFPSRLRTRRASPALRFARATHTRVQKNVSEKSSRRAVSTASHTPCCSVRNVKRPRVSGSKRGAKNTRPRHTPVCRVQRTLPHENAVLDPDEGRHKRQCKTKAQEGCGKQPVRRRVLDCPKFLSNCPLSARTLERPPSAALSNSSSGLRFLKCVDFGVHIRQSIFVMMNLSRMTVCLACCCNCCVRLSSAPGAS